MLLRNRNLSHSAIRRNKVLYSKTLLLPATKFLPKIPKGTERTELIEKCGTQLYHWQKNRPDFAGNFVLHDGPPYANGDLHLGHSLNKVLKDIINRFELIHNNSRVHYTPGWDCHGLPIEIKAVQDAGQQSAAESRRLCRELAEFMIEKQRSQFLEFGIMADFSAPYVTMSHEYEAKQLRVFLKLFENGLLSRQLKPVWWGCETQTALAEAELEYNSKHKSVAIFVKFPVKNSDFSQKYGNVQLVIWTSTPWTIPANMAICVHRELEYTLLEKGGERIVVASELAQNILNLAPEYTQTGISFLGAELEGLCYENPSFRSSEEFPILHGDHVSATAGTGLVHTAPAHGMEDYVIGQKHNLHVASLVDAKGLYVAGIPPGFQELCGKYANSRKTIGRVLELLGPQLFHADKNYTHSYPYDWRSKTPVIQRATPQWFVNVEKIKAVALRLLENVEFVPEAGKNRLALFVTNRSEWCISRQRTWGVPLPIVYHKDTHEPVTDIDAIRHIVGKLGELGTDQWFEDEPDISRWVHFDGADYYKGRDTMDVWFDSGTSWTTLAENLDEICEAKVPVADVYLEGSDQHRGWFQSSLLNKIIASTSNGVDFTPVAPFKKIITHGFTLDTKNDKMSKSKGNVISPAQVIDGGGKPRVPALGTDGLRLWVASSNYTLDVNVSSEVLLRVLENVKKLRVTFKYVLGNLQDFHEPVAYGQLAPLDRWVLSKLRTLQDSVVENYKGHGFAKVVREMNAHVSELSALYFDVCKDCLYTFPADSLRRRSVQTVLEQVLRCYVGLLAPIQPLLAQEVWELYAEQFGRAETSPFMVPWEFYRLPEQYHDAGIENEFEQIWKIRDGLYKHMEALRAEGRFKNKLEAEVFVCGSPLLEKHREYLDDYFLVSRATVGPIPAGLVPVDVEGVSVAVTHSSSCKCPRCWKYIAEVENEVCVKCSAVI